MKSLFCALTIALSWGGLVAPLCGETLSASEKTKQDLKQATAPVPSQASKKDSPQDPARDPERASTVITWVQPGATQEEQVHNGSWYWGNPIGNGRLGGIVYGNPDLERIHINDDTFWSGAPRKLQKPDAHKFLPEVRKLMSEGKENEASALMEREWLGPYNECYMPVTDILLSFPDTGAVSEYKRELDMKRGVVTLSYKRGEVTYTREVFCSYPDQVIVMRLTADKPGSLSFDATLKSQQEIREVKVAKNAVYETGEAPVHASPHYLGVVPPVYKKGEGMRFAAQLLVKNEGGTLADDGTSLKVKDADAVTLIFAAATSFNGADKHPAKEGKDEKALCKAYIDKVLPKSYEKLKSTHEKDFSALFSRVSLDLGISPEAELPLAQRIGGFYKPENDPALTALYFQFGRYITISSSRPGSNAMYLQGIWSKDMQPAWSCNYTLNCNVQIAYWGIEAVNLSECHLPMAELAREASIDGAKTAKALYGQPGWTAHHNLDIWRTTWPVGGSGSWALYQVGGAWLCHHIWEHYAYSLDKAFLKKYYPLLKGNTEFFLGMLIPDKNGDLINCPSESFEHGYQKPDGTGGWACAGSAQDMQIIRTLFENTIAASEILGDDKAFRDKVKDKLAKLAPPRISPTTGELQEWNEDWICPSPLDGQVGHGWGMGVGSVITLRGTPEFAEAFRKCVEARQVNNGGNSGSWPGAFALSFRVRLAQPEEAQDILDRHFTHAVANNFFSHFSGYPMIDGTLGMESGIVQMLLQSHAKEIDLLPCLPAKYPKGKVKGLRAKGACTVDITWDKGLLTEATITSDKGGTYPVRSSYGVKMITLKPGESLTLKPADFTPDQWTKVAPKTAP